MAGLPVTIRLLDPPLHEFVPHEERLVRELAVGMGKNLEAVKARIEKLQELNPMLGHRGCRLGITYPEITRMQATAILEATAELLGGKGRCPPRNHDPAGRHRAGADRPEGHRARGGGRGAEEIRAAEAPLHRRAP